MGGQNPDYLGSAISAERAWTLAQLWTLQAMVEARCDTCRVRLRVDLDGLLRARGPDYSLWNKTPRCRVVGCRGGGGFGARDRPGGPETPLRGERRIAPAPLPRWLGQQGG
jgi:hypothetical protein